MRYDFDEAFDRRTTGAGKWLYLPEDTIPMTVADMDFRLAPEIIEAVQTAVVVGESGYVNMAEADY